MAGTLHCSRWRRQRDRSKGSTSVDLIVDLDSCKRSLEFERRWAALRDYEFGQKRGITLSQRHAVEREFQRI